MLHPPRRGSCLQFADTRTESFAKSGLVEKFAARHRPLTLSNFVVKWGGLQLVRYQVPKKLAVNLPQTCSREQQPSLGPSQYPVESLLGSGNRICDAIRRGTARR